MSDNIEDIARKILKLKRSAERAPSPEEAAVFAAKAQELLEQYNLDLSSFDETKIESGRVDEAFEGGRFQYQRDLWEAVARLNFCLHDIQRKAVKTGGTTRFKFFHSVVGRKVNVAATQVLARYLEQAIDRELKRRLSQTSVRDSRWATSFRSGAALTIVNALYERRGQKLSAERQAMADLAAEATKDASTSNALSLAVLVDKETDANIDFLCGEGTAAKLAAERQAKAAEAREKEERYTKWALANPEKARKAEARRKAAQEARDDKARQKDLNDFYRKHDISAFRQGQIAGEKIGIDPQVDKENLKRIAHG